MYKSLTNDFCYICYNESFKLVQINVQNYNFEGDICTYNQVFKKKAFISLSISFCTSKV